MEGYKKFWKNQIEFDGMFYLINKCYILLITILWKSFCFNISSYIIVRIYCCTSDNLADGSPITMQSSSATHRHLPLWQFYISFPNETHYPNLTLCLGSRSSRHCLLRAMRTFSKSHKFTPLLVEISFKIMSKLILH